MIIETLIATIGAVTIVGTWLGLRFAGRAMGLDRKATGDEQRKALSDVERYIGCGYRPEMRALLAVRAHHLPDDVRERAQAWLGGGRS